MVKEWAGDQAPVSSQKAWPAAAFKKKKNNNLLFCTKVELINNVVMVSGEQQRDSAIHTHVSILPQTHLPSRLPQNIEQSSLCYTVGPCRLSILNIAVCT